VRVTIRAYDHRGAGGTADVFFCSVREVAVSEYTVAQVEAWVPGAWIRSGRISGLVTAAWSGLPLTRMTVSSRSSTWRQITARRTSALRLIRRILPGGRSRRLVGEAIRAVAPLPPVFPVVQASRLNAQDVGAIFAIGATGTWLSSTAAGGGEHCVEEQLGDGPPDQDILGLRQIIGVSLRDLSGTGDLGRVPELNDHSLVSCRALRHRRSIK
jgi:hypothetical protein